MSWSIPHTKRSYFCRGDYVAFLRERRGWTQEELAAIVGYSARLIRKAESSENLNPETVDDLADALGTPDQPVYPEDLVSDPVAAAALLLECYEKHGLAMLDHCSHIFSDDFVYWCAGDKEEVPIAGTYRGLAGLQEWLDQFFSMFTMSKAHPLNPQFVVAGNEVVARYQSVVVMNGVVTPPVWIIQISKFRRGKIFRLENYFDTGTGERILREHSDSDAR